jgi:hypothetical protein
MGWDSIILKIKKISLNMAKKRQKVHFAHV